MSESTQLFFDFGRSPSRRLAYACGDLSEEEFEQRRTKLVRDEET